jgi:hypothetical protein
LQQAHTALHALSGGRAKPLPHRARLTGCS